MAYNVLPTPVIRIANGVPENKAPNPIEAKERAQLTSMLNSVPKVAGLTDFGSWLNNIVYRANGLGISTLLCESKPFGEDRKHVYLLLSASKEIMDKMKETNCKDLPDWIEYSKDNGRGILLLDKVVIDITDIDRHNFFQMNSMIMRQLQDMSIVQTAFEGEGYELPKFVHANTVHSIWELDNMRDNQSVPAQLRERYKETYKKAIADYAQMYNDKYRDVISDVPRRKRHRVSEKYFKENHIPLTWETVHGDFYKFIKKELKKGRFPEFVYYKAPAAHIKTKNLAKAFKKIKAEGFINFWEKDTGTRKYYFCFPATQEHIFYTLMNEYNTRNMEHKCTVSQVQALNTPLSPTQLIYVPVNDIYNWNRLCTANNVMWAVDDGTVLKRKITDREAVEAIPVIYPFKDMNMVNAIVSRLSKEIREYVPYSDQAMFEWRNQLINKVAAEYKQEHPTDNETKKNNFTHNDCR